MLLPRITISLKSAATKISTRSFSNTNASAAKVAVLGAAGGIGQPLSMLCKLSNEIDELACYDIVGTPGVAADLSHVSYLESCTPFGYTRVDCYDDLCLFLCLLCVYSAVFGYSNHTQSCHCSPYFVRIG